MKTFSCTANQGFPSYMKDGIALPSHDTLKSVSNIQTSLDCFFEWQCLTFDRLVRMPY